MVGFHFRAIPEIIPKSALWEYNYSVLEGLQPKSFEDFERKNSAALRV